MYICVDSMEEERTNWTNREMDFEETIHELKQEMEEKQITIGG